MSTSIGARGALLVLSLLALGAATSGCDNPPSGTDAGRDAGRAPDAGDPFDAGETPDGGGTTCGDSVCTEAESCVRGRCLAHCGGDLSALEAGLDGRITPHFNACVSGLAFDVVPGAAAPTVYALSTESAGALTTWRVGRFAYDRSTSTPTLEELGSHDFDAGDPATMVFPNGYLSVSPSELFAAFGFTTSPLGGGQVVILALGVGTAGNETRPGNYWADWLGDEYLLIDEKPTDAPHVVSSYTPTGIATVIDGISDFSAALNVGEGFVLAGGLDATTFADALFVFPRAEVEMAAAGDIGPLTEAGHQRIDGVPGGALRLLSGNRLTTSAFGGDVSVHSYGYSDATGLTIGAPFRVGSAEVIYGAYDGGPGQLLLAHAHGLMLVEIVPD